MEPQAAPAGCRRLAAQEIVPLNCGFVEEMEPEFRLRVGALALAEGENEARTGFRVVKLKTGPGGSAEGSAPIGKR